MKTNPENNESRREFLKSIVRTLLLSGIISVGGFLGWRKICSTNDGNLCAIKLPCKNCPRYADCPNPIAE